MQNPYGSKPIPFAAIAVQFQAYEEEIRQLSNLLIRYH